MVTITKTKRNISMVRNRNHVSVYLLVRSKNVYLSAEEVVCWKVNRRKIVVSFLPPISYASSFVVVNNFPPAR